MTAGPFSDYPLAITLLGDLLKTQWLNGDYGRDADWFKDA